MSKFYVRSGEIDACLDAEDAKAAAKAALKEPAKQLGQQVFVSEEPIAQGVYNGEVIFLTNSLLDEMNRENPNLRVV